MGKDGRGGGDWEGKRSEGDKERDGRSETEGAKMVCKGDNKNRLKEDIGI